ncbi:MAG: hypothetical protein Udaeo2_12790 [Candidatus Udaeobacter sp.]|nr:MAG: hypothetical protein Udaeo2_12790 [Candidatus Udaeobacter sp.]
MVNNSKALHAVLSTDLHRRYRKFLLRHDPRIRPVYAKKLVGLSAKRLFDIIETGPTGFAKSMALAVSAPSLITVAAEQKTCEIMVFLQPQVSTRGQCAL